MNTTSRRGNGKKITARDMRVTSPAAKVPMGQLDGLLNGGLPRGSITMVYGQPGCGKSTLITEMACAAKESGAEVVYAVSPMEGRRRDVILLAKRIGAPLIGVTVADCKTIEEALYEAEENKAQVLFLDSYPSLSDYRAPEMKRNLQVVKEWAWDRERIVVGIGMYTTKKGVRAGGYAIPYGADAVLDIYDVESDDAVGFGFPGDATLRVVELWKSRSGPTDYVTMQMTGRGLVPYCQIEDQIANWGVSDPSR
jgi:predicted ATP-dependent serine protease